MRAKAECSKEPSRGRSEHAIARQVVRVHDARTRPPDEPHELRDRQPVPPVVLGVEPSETVQRQGELARLEGCDRSVDATLGERGSEPLDVTAR